MAVGLALVWVMAPWNQAGWTHILPYAPLIPCIGIILVIALAEWWVPALRAARTGALSGKALRPIKIGRVCIRLYGFIATLAVIAFAYWLLPEYHGDFYAPYWLFLRTLAPVALLVPFYFLWADSRSVESHDEYYEFGRVFLGRWRSADWPLIGRHLLGWTVKAFFLPLMTVYLGSELRSLYGALQGAAPATMPIYQVFYHLSYAVDLLYCVVGYALCTVSFGLRFSNLTNRGIITGGPYRFTKHPAYLAKNLSWWLISVPFVSEQGVGAALRNCCLLGLLNCVYYARARTEERHLSRDPTYVAYALWINEHGLLRRLARALPWLRYRAPAAGAEKSAPARKQSNRASFD